MTTRHLPRGVYTAWRGGYHFVVSYNPNPFEPRLPAGAMIVHGKLPLAPASVLVWKDGAR